MFYIKITCVNYDVYIVFSFRDKERKMTEQRSTIQRKQNCAGLNESRRSNVRREDNMTDPLP